MMLLKLLSTNGLATTDALNTVENKIPDMNNTVQKETDFDAKISDIETKYFARSGYNKFTNEIVNAKIKENIWLINLIFLDR